MSMPPRVAGIGVEHLASLILAIDPDSVGKGRVRRGTGAVHAIDLRRQ